MYVISANVKYTSTSGATAQTDTSLKPVPQLYYVHSFTNVPISIGLGVYAPGLSLNWGNSGPFNTVVESGSLVFVLQSGHRLAPCCGHHRFFYRNGFGGTIVFPAE